MTDSELNRGHVSNLTAAGPDRGARPVTEALPFRGHLCRRHTISLITIFDHVIMLIIEGNCKLSVLDGLVAVPLAPATGLPIRVYRSTTEK